MTTALVDARETWVARLKSAKDIFEKYDGDVGKMSDDDAAEIDRLNKETAELGAKVEKLAGLEEKRLNTDAELKRLSTPVNGGGMRFETRDPEAVAAGDESQKPKLQRPGDAFIKASEFKSWRPRGGNQTIAVEFPRGPKSEVKATFTQTLAQLTSYERVPGIVTVGTQKPHIADLLAQGTTNAVTVRYVRENSFANAADAVAEGALKPEASFDTTEADAPVRKIAVTAKVTDELFADFAMLRDYINGRLDNMLELKEDTELLTGSGTAPHILGLLNTAGIQTQARGTDPGPDAVYKAMVKVMTVGYFDPDGIVMHPLNWQAIRLLTTTTGSYLFGNPADTAPARLWGLTVVETTAMTQNTALVGAFKLGAQLWQRDEGAVEATNSNEDDFKRNLIALRDEERIALSVNRPLAFCTVTGLP